MEEIIITNNYYKEKILEKKTLAKEIHNYKFFTMTEFIKNFYFDTDYNTIYYIINKYHYNISVTKEYLKNLYYLKDYNYKNKKLLFLYNLKNELDQNNLLIYNNLFKGFIKGKKIIFYKFNYFNKLEKKLIEDLKKICQVEVINKEFKKYIPSFYQFKNIYEEISFVASNISNLISKGICIDKIKISNISSEYNMIIEYIFSLYNLNIITLKNSIYATPIVQEFLSNLDNISDKINLLKEKYSKSSVFQKLVQVVNKYIVLENISTVKELIVDELKHTYIDDINTTNSIEVVDYIEYPFSDDEYLFLINFNENTPYTYKDEEYINDILCDNTYKDTSIYLNKITRSNAIKNIYNIKNIFITYSNSTFFNEYLPSNLLNDLEYNDIDYTKDYSITYSKKGDELDLCMMLDDYFKTGKINDNLYLLYNNYLSIPYNTFDNSFKGIDKNLFLNYINKKLSLSYSSMDNYYKCPFRYYLANILKLDIYEDNFITYLGSLFHYVLEENLKNGTDIDNAIKNFIKKENKELNNKELFFIENIRNDIEFSLNRIKAQLKDSDFKNMLFEEKISIKKRKDNIDVLFNGKIDKILYTDDYKYCAVVDYKTGPTDISLKDIPNGLGMQLPLYLYLVKHHKLFSKSLFAGFYLQQVLHNKPNIDFKKSLGDLKKDSLLLYGYSNNCKDILEKFDYTYENSEYIKSLKLLKSGEFSKNAKIISNKEIDKLIKICDKKIDEAIENILNAKFIIEPKKDVKENIGCKYCKFKDICYKEYKDEKLIISDTNLDYLGDKNE